MKTITSLAKSRIKYNKSRTLLTAIAIMLTTVLLMGLAASVLGLIDIQRQKAVAEGNQHAIFKNLNSGQLEILKNHLDIESIEASEIFATIEYGKMNGFLTFGKALKGGITHNVGKMLEGREAQSVDEICSSAAFFRRMDVEPVIGNKMTVSFRPQGKGQIQTREFTICGIQSSREIEGYNLNDANVIYGAEISEALVNEFVAPKDRVFNAVVIRAKGENSLNYAEMKAKIEAIAKDIGCDTDNIKFNTEYLVTMLDPTSEMASVVCGVALLIIIFSGLVIYSIYYVSVITDVQEIGKLKALGASKKHIKRLFLSEGLRVSALAIPPGIILGYSIPFFFLPIVMNKAAETTALGITLEHIDMFSIPAMMIVAAAVLITVCISLLVPMRIASKVSPIEAIRYQESSCGKKIRSGNSEVNVFRLSTANLTRNKKRTAVTMITMGLSCVLFMTVAGVMNSMSAEDIARRNVDMGEFKLTLDASLNDQEYPENNLDSLQKQNMFHEDFLNRIRQIDGVKDIIKTSRVLVRSDFDTDMFREGKRITLSPFTREDIGKMKEDLKRGELDYDKMTAENGVIYARDQFWDEENLQIGDTIPITVIDGDREISIDVKIAASTLTAKAGTLQIPQAVWDKLGMKVDTTTDIFLSVDKKKYDGVKAAMQDIADTNEHFILYSLDEEMSMGYMSVNIIKYPMYVILIMIAVIGFMNLINTMITSIVTRKRELGVLQAIGLSNRQLTKMLAGEGMVFTAGTLLAAVTLGNLFGYLAFKWAKAAHFMSVSAYHYPIVETVALACVLILGQIVITQFISSRVKKESLIDRIRSGE